MIRHSQSTISTSFIKKFTKVYGSIRAETNLYRLK